MTPLVILRDVVLPGLDYLTKTIGSGGPSIDDSAQVMIMAIWGQESAWKYRRQNGGPARSFGQFENHGGGVSGVMGNATTAAWLRTLCASLDIPYDQDTIFEAMAWSDHLAVAMTRFNLWCAPGALPAIGQVDAAYRYYDAQWRPGEKRPQDWPANYDAAMRAVVPVSA